MALCSSSCQLYKRIFDIVSWMGILTITIGAYKLRAYKWHFAVALASCIKRISDLVEKLVTIQKCLYISVDSGKLPQRIDVRIPWSKADRKAKGWYLLLLSIDRLLIITAEYTGQDYCCSVPQFVPHVST